MIVAVIDVPIEMPETGLRRPVRELSPPSGASPIAVFPEPLE